MLDQLVQNGGIDLSGIQKFCRFCREPKLFYVIILPVGNIRFSKKEVCGHFKILGDPDDVTVTKILCATLEISAEGTVRKTDLFCEFGLGDLSVFDEILDTLPGIAGKISVGHKLLLLHFSSL